MRFRIEGHTDAVGSHASNVALSRRRAQTVADFLVAMGVPRSRIDVQGYGPDRPLPGTTRYSPQNRRVEAVRVS
jgi:outer membrane protein OmpA-like peptidoglycan-associated protein